MGLEVLAGLLDDKLIKIITVFTKYPDKRFYLSEVSRLSGINNATTSRMLHKLALAQFITVMKIGKVRTYQLSKGEKAEILARLLKKNERDPLTHFCEELQELRGIHKALLDTRTATSAKLILVTEGTLRNTIESLCKKLYLEKKFKVTFIEITHQQYEALKTTSTFNLDKKILFNKLR